MGLRLLHFAEIKLHSDHKDYHDDSQQSVKIKGNGLQKQAKAIQAAAFRQAGAYRRGPA